MLCRVITAIGDSVVAVPPTDSRRSTGTARTRVGVSSYQSGAAESTIWADSKASVTCFIHSGLMFWPTKSR